MKKAKWMLAAILLVSTIGGILSFKANHYHLTTWFAYTSVNSDPDSDHGPGCFFRISLFYTVDLSEAIDPTTFQLQCTTSQISTSDELHGCDSFGYLCQ